MNYHIIYDTICERAKRRTLLGMYTERHHIIPKCLGGSDDPSNIAVLTGKEHFIVHRLLTRLYPTNLDLAYAAWMMSRRLTISSANYHSLKEHVSSLAKGRPSSFKGKTHTPEAKAKVSSARKGKATWNKGIPSLSAESKVSIGTKNSEALLGKPKTEEHRANIAKARTGKPLSEAHKAVIRATKLKKSP
jgi:hypothetical protein